MTARTIHLRSSAIRELVYDPGSRVLGLRFADGDWYAYADVPAAAVEALLAAPSIGRHFAEHIRDRFRYAVLEDV